MRFFFFCPAQGEAQSIYSLFVDRIAISPANGQTDLASYLVRFGIFINNFSPTEANFSQWDANFRGSTGAISGSGGRFAPNDYGGQFSISNNAQYPLGSQLYMVAYNVEAGASVASATKGVILTRSDWILSGPESVTSGRRVSWRRYYYAVDGTRVAMGDLAEENIAAVTSTNGFSSPVSSFSVGSGGVLQTSFDMVPEPSAVSLLAIGFGGWMVLRRVRRRTD